MVSRVHDMGGQTGFGPVPVEDDGQFFHADWEARVYAIVRVLQRRELAEGADEMDEIELAALVSRNGLIGTAIR